MIDKREILEAASSFSLLPNVVEKDYVLGWILAGINAHEELAESWAFKGGTSYGQKSAPFQFSDAERRSISGSPLLFPRDLRAWCAYLMTDLTDGTLRRG
jgi:hypothetical protein